MTTNRQRKRDQRAREKAARAERRRDRPRPTVSEQYGRPVTRESIEDEMRRRGLLR